MTRALGVGESPGAGTSGIPRIFKLILVSTVLEPQGPRQLRQRQFAVMSEQLLERDKQIILLKRTLQEFRDVLSTACRWTVGDLGASG